MSIVLATASLLRGRPSWFTKNNRDWGRLTFAAWGTAVAIEITALALGLISNDPKLALSIALFAPIVYCLTQSLVTDILYRRADAVSLSVAALLVFIPALTVQPLLGLIWLAVASLAYLTLRSDGLAITLLLSVCATLAQTLNLFFFALIIGAVTTAILSSIYSKRHGSKGLPMVPIILAASILSLGFLVGYDIAI